MAREEAIEIGRIAKAEAIGDLLDRQTALVEAAPGFLDQPCVENGLWRHPRHQHASIVQPAARHAEEVGKSLDADAISEMQLNQLAVAMDQSVVSTGDGSVSAFNRSATR